MTEENRKTSIKNIRRKAKAMGKWLSKKYMHYANMFEKMSTLDVLKYAIGATVISAVSSYIGKKIAEKISEKIADKISNNDDEPELDMSQTSSWDTLDNGGDSE